MSADIVARMFDFQEKLISVVKRERKMSITKAYQLGEEFGVGPTTVRRAIHVVTEPSEPLCIIRERGLLWIVPR